MDGRTQRADVVGRLQRKRNAQRRPLHRALAGIEIRVAHDDVQHEHLLAIVPAAGVRVPAARIRVSTDATRHRLDRPRRAQHLVGADVEDHHRPVLVGGRKPDHAQPVVAHFDHRVVCVGDDSVGKHPFPVSVPGAHGADQLPSAAAFPGPRWRRGASGVGAMVGGHERNVPRDHRLPRHLRHRNQHGNRQSVARAVDAAVRAARLRRDPRRARHPRFPHRVRRPRCRDRGDRGQSRRAVVRQHPRGAGGVRPPAGAGGRVFLQRRRHRRHRRAPGHRGRHRAGTGRPHGRGPVERRAVGPHQASRGALRRPGGRIVRPGRRDRRGARTRRRSPPSAGQGRPRFPARRRRSRRRGQDAPEGDQLPAVGAVDCFRREPSGRHQRTRRGHHRRSRAGGPVAGGEGQLRPLRPQGRPRRRLADPAGSAQRAGGAHRPGVTRRPCPRLRRLHRPRHRRGPRQPAGAAGGGPPARRTRPPARLRHPRRLRHRRRNRR